jgi:Tol biopolymer transport system component
VTLAAGTQLGPYEVIAPLGAGGMGEVYRARDPRLGREVAVKVLPERLTREPDRLRRFEVEARAAGALNHPNVLVVHDIGRQDDRPYVVYELLDGQTLSERMRSGRLTGREAVDFAVQMARGLAAAHARDIVHRDLKPDNLFITEDGRVKILDFGLAKLLRPEPQGEAEIDREEATLTRQPSTGEGVVLGTVGYMSPEQVRGVPADHRTDIFSFGVVLYEMLSGRRPFERETAAETLTAILREDPPALSSPDVSPATAQIVARCLDKKPERRFQSAHDLALALGAVSGLESRARSATGVGLERATTAWIRRVVTWTLEAAAVVGLGLGLWYALAPGGPPAISNPTRLTAPDGLWKWGMATDGQWLYYSTLEGRLFQMAVSGGQPKELDPWPGEERVTWVGGLSPADSTTLLVRSGPKPTLWAGFGRRLPVSVAASAPLPLWTLSLPAATPRRLGEVVANAVSWSPEGAEIAFSDGRDIFIVGRSGESPRKIATVEATLAFVMDWSPDGWINHVAYIFEDNRMEAWRMRPDGSERHRILPDWPRSHFWAGDSTPDGSYLFFVSGWEHTGAIWALREGSAEPVQLTKDPMRCESLMVGPEGEHLYATSYERRGELFVYRPEIDEWLPYDFPAEPSARHLSFSRDGEWVAWVEYPEGTLWRSRRDGTRKLQLTEPAGFYASQPRWSPDGRRIAFVTGTMMGFQLRAFVVGKDGEGLRPVVEEASLPNTMDWSPDGRLVVSFSGDDGGQLRIVDLETGKTEELPGTRGLAGVASSPDGRYLAAHDFGSRTAGGLPGQIRLLDWQTRDWRALDGAVGGNIHWSADSRYLYFDDGAGGVRRIPSSGGAIERVADLGRLRPEGWWWSVDPEGRIVRLRTLSTSDIYAWDLKVP